MNRQLLFLGASLGAFAVFVCIAIIFFTEKLYTENTVKYIYLVGLQLNAFHSLLIIMMAWIKRKYVDQNLITVGWIFTISVLLFSGSAYISMFNEFGVTLFNTVGLIGGIGLVIGWAFLFREFYNSFILKRKNA
jgi:uncharacterized membrane protein YgdD (TMEM256/DUF423 family)